MSANVAPPQQDSVLGKGSAYPAPRGSRNGHHHHPQHHGTVPTLETPDGVWDGSADPSRHRRREDRQGSFDSGDRQPMMRMQNRSTPSLVTPTSSTSSYHSDEGLPYDNDSTGDLGMGGLSVQDPVQRTGTSNSYRSTDQRRYQQQQQPYDTQTLYSRSSVSDSGDRPAPSGHHPSMRRGPGPGRGPPPPQQQYPAYGIPPQSVYSGQGWTGPPPQMYAQPAYDPLLAAASDVLGLGPPPGSTPYAGPPPGQAPYAGPPPGQPYGGPPPGQAPYAGPPPGQPYAGPPPGQPYNYSNSSLPPPQQHPSYAASSSSLAPYDGASIRRAPSTASNFSTGPHPGMQRAPPTNVFSDLKTRKTKAIDVNAPPYTKEYVEEYRARIKADPDPEAHFAFAKYLIEAAKKLGGADATNATEQRAARKYRDTLIAESLKVMRRLATQGETYAEAQFFLANCHGTGMLGLQVDHERAYYLYLQAAKQDLPAACYRVAVCNDIGAGTKKDPQRAFQSYRKAASLGDTAAMYKLGTILLKGDLGQQPNAREAVQWLKRAAEQADEDNPHALYTLATLHAKPDNEGMVIYDEPYALDLFTKAGQLGHTGAQVKLGSCYESGTLGCAVDPRKSIAWYTKAAEKGDPEAELCLSGWYLTGAEGVLKQSDTEAYLWAHRAATKGYPRAEYAVGYYYEVGIGVTADTERARRWYMRAAAQSHKRAMGRLTELKKLGNKKSNAVRPTRQQHADENCVVM